MITKEFIDLLSANKQKELLFEYAPGLLVGANYHITEVKHVHIDSVDCGGQSDSWSETVIQLWEDPNEIGKKDYMTVQKALQILQQVSKVKAYNPSAIVKLEYSNSQFHKAQLDISKIKDGESQLVLSLFAPQTDCKAKELCGVPQPAQSEAESCCSPSSGCC